MNENISKLKDLIEVYESEEEYLEHLSEMWNEFSESMNDDEFRKNQEEVVKSSYDNIITFATNLKQN